VFYYGLLKYNIDYKSLVLIQRKEIIHT